MGDDAELEQKKAARYSSRLSRARTANNMKMGLKAGNTESMANMAFSIPVQSEVDMAAAGVANMAVSGGGTPSNRAPPKPVKKIESDVSVFTKPEDENSIAAFWEWNEKQRLLAVVSAHARAAPTARPGARYFFLARAGRGFSSGCRLATAPAAPLPPSLSLSDAAPSRAASARARSRSTRSCSR